MKKIILSFFFFLNFFTQNISAQLILNADGPGNTYELITSKLADGHDPVEEPDCSHPSFGKHIDEVFDADLNKNVFRFFIHTSTDDDRCINFDRQRNEIKAYDKSPDSLLGIAGETFEYKWKFKLDAGFQSSQKFTHIHQLKAVGGTESSMPLITLTTRKGSPDQLELRYAETTSQITLDEVSLSPFKGEWCEVIETVTYGESGTYDITIKKVSDNTTLFSYSNDDIRMWKTQADFIRPKWGIYRSLLYPDDLRDEEILFANFSIWEMPLVSAVIEYPPAKEIHLFPNPTDETVQILGTNEDIIFEIFDSNGIKVLDGKTTDSKIYLAELPTAIYLIKLYLQDETITKKLVKK